MPNPEDGNYRYVAERRQYGGLLMVTGLCAVIQPLASIANGIGPDGPIATDVRDVAFWKLIGYCCLFAIGVSSMLVGFMEFIMDNGEVTQATLLILLTQTAYIPYLADMIEVGLIMVKDPPQFFIPFPNDPTAALANQQKINETQQVIFIGSCGIAGIFCYTLAFVGAIAFMQFALYTFRRGKPQDRNADYFRMRLGVYSVMLFIGGICQILLGSFATELDMSNGGRIQGGLIQVAMFVVHFPYVTIAVGCLQFLNGFWGFCRACYVCVGGRADNTFQYSMALLWIIVLTCQDVVQIALLPDGMLAAAAPTLAAFSFGIIFMPAYLDYKMRNTPIRMDLNYYFGPAPSSPKDEEQPMLVRAILSPGAVPGPRPNKTVYVMEKRGYYQEDLEYDYLYNGDGHELEEQVAEPKGLQQQQTPPDAVDVPNAGPDPIPEQAPTTNNNDSSKPSKVVEQQSDKPTMAPTEQESDNMPTTVVGGEHGKPRNPAIADEDIEAPTNYPNGTLPTGPGP